MTQLRSWLGSRKAFNTLLAVVVAASLLLPAAAYAVGAVVSQYDGEMASADFYAYDPATKTHTYAYAFGWNERSQGHWQPGKPERFRQVSGEVYIYQWCEDPAPGEWWDRWGWARVSPADFSVDKKLASARLVMNEEGQWWSHGPTGPTVEVKPMTVDLTWTGVGEVSAYKDHWVTHPGGGHSGYRGWSGYGHSGNNGFSGYIYNDKWFGSQRDSVVSGVFSDGDDDYAANADEVSAYLGSYSGRSVFVEVGK